MNTFSLGFLRQSLIDRSAFIYHGAGIAKGVGNQQTNDLPFLDRLRNVMDHDLEICCSTVREGDSEVDRDFWGKIGLILWPRSPNSITLVSEKDAGTTPDPNRPGRRVIPREPVTAQALINSIDQRPENTANEWCLLDYEVKGIFVEPPIQYNEHDELKELKLPQVFEEFPNWRVYAFYYGSLREILPSAQWGALVSIAELYPSGKCI